jgi:hypothetical protein
MLTSPHAFCCDNKQYVNKHREIKENEITLVLIMSMCSLQVGINISMGCIASIFIVVGWRQKRSSKQQM